MYKKIFFQCMILLLFITSNCAAIMYVPTAFDHCKSVGFKPDLKEDIKEIHNLTDTQLEEFDMDRDSYLEFFFGNMGEDCCKYTVDKSKCEQIFIDIEETQQTNSRYKIISYVIFFLLFAISILYLIFGKKIINNEKYHNILKTISILCIIICVIIVLFYYWASKIIY